MNVLILTPDAVGSTLLQRMLTIYMQFHEFDRPVINLHELTNGLARYYSPEFNRELVGKKTLQNWGYYQTLSEVIELLDSVDHYKTSRLAHYHIRRRGDTVEQQIPFYQYLNDNFYVISCRRTNVFEQALSMTLNKITKKLNVYSHYEKVDTFYTMYQSGVTLDPAVLVNELNAYKRYVDWCDQYFNVSSYFNYEQDIPRLEQFILDLPVFANQKKRVTWDNNFDISFNDWNKMHYLYSDVSSLPPNLDQDPNTRMIETADSVREYRQHAPQDWPAVESTQDIAALPDTIKQQWTQHCISHGGLMSLMSEPCTNSITAHHKRSYLQAQQTIDQMIELGIMISGPPIKKQCLGEKVKMIRNFDALFEVYNDWASENTNVAQTLTHDSLQDKVETERQFWRSAFNSSDQLPAMPPNQPRLIQNGDRHETDLIDPFLSREDL